MLTFPSNTTLGAKEPMNFLSSTFSEARASPLLNDLELSLKSLASGVFAVHKFFNRGGGFGNLSSMTFPSMQQVELVSPFHFLAEHLGQMKFIAPMLSSLSFISTTICFPDKTA